MFPTYKQILLICIISLFVRNLFTYSKIVLQLNNTLSKTVRIITLLIPCLQIYNVKFAILIMSYLQMVIVFLNMIIKIVKKSKKLKILKVINALNAKLDTYSY